MTPDAGYKIERPKEYWHLKAVHTSLQKIYRLLSHEARTLGQDLATSYLYASNSSTESVEKTDKCEVSKLNPNLFVNYPWVEEFIILGLHLVLPLVKILQNVLQFFCILSNIHLQPQRVRHLGCFVTSQCLIESFHAQNMTGIFGSRAFCGTLSFRRRFVCTV